MRIKKFRSIFIPFVTFCIIIAASAAVIAYGRGYRIDFRKNSVKPTGLISATSDPIGAQLYIDDKLKTATNNSINIDPGWYKVRVSKEGFLSWEKNLRVQGEIVTRADAFLFPTNPSLSPLTTVGIEHPILSPDGGKIAYTIPLDSKTVAPKKAGLWVYQLAEGPLGRNRDPQQIDGSDSTFNFSESTISWSPDSTQLVAQIGPWVRLYTINRTGTFQDISLTYELLLKDWGEEKQTKERQKLAAFKQGIIDIASSSAKIISFSPDETKILYEATATATLPRVIEPPLLGTNPTAEERSIAPGKIYVYDSREDKNYFVLDKKELPQPKAGPSPSPTPRDRRTGPTPTPTPSIAADNGRLANIHWFPTSRHLVLTLEGKIDIMEYDRTNWVTIYSGPFVENFIAPWPNGSRIIVMTNLNSTGGVLPNLYTVNLR